MKFHMLSSLYRRLTIWKLVLLIPVFYLLIVWWGYQYIERQMHDNHRQGRVFKPHLNKEGNIQLYVNQCPIYYHGRRKHKEIHGHAFGTINQPELCHLPSSHSSPDIQMENEWKSISVRYPQYVYTVSGWIQVIDVPNYTPKPLKVIILPHSHQDPGWKESYEGYYSSYTRNTLRHIVKHLSENPKLKFIWSEITYLKKWFEEKESDRKGLLKLIKNGQLEIVTGGWVMTDEAVSHYTAMLNQLIDGHQWMKQTLGILPNTSWSVDPFGHSPTMTYLLSQARIRHMVIQRTHYAIKRHFAKRRNLEFVWRQAWDATGGSAVLCHMMPFLLYAISFSCGPDPHVCCQFDFSSSKCYRGTESIPAVTVNDKNIRKLSWSLWEQLQKKSHLYRSNVLLVPHGDDFRYSSASEWSEQFDNLGKLIDYMNGNEDMNIQIQYGTVSDYFNALEQSRNSLDFQFPSLSGDFFPYNDRDDQYWTGFYSVRPLLKHMIRVLQAKLRISEILFTLTCSRQDKKGLMFFQSYIPYLVDVRHAVNLFHHHDAITGTSKHYVMNDYGKIMKTAVDKLDILLLVLMLKNVEEVVTKPESLDPFHYSMTSKWTSHTSQPVVQVNKVNGEWIAIVTNPLSIAWKSAVSVRTSSTFIVKTKDTLVPSQINPVLDSNLQLVDGQFDIVFEADLPPLAIKIYRFLKDSTAAKFTQVSVFGSRIDHFKYMSKFEPLATGLNNKTIDIENGVIRASFSPCTGTLQYTLNKADDEVMRTSIQMVTYGTGSYFNPLKDKSGAYIFMPDGPAKDLDVQYPSIIVIKGPVMSSVTTKLPGVVHTASLYNIDGPVARGIHIQNSVNIDEPCWDNKELTMRIVSDVISPDTSVCVDLNGFQMTKKKWRSKLLIQGNFHPVTSAAFIENGDTSRLTLLTSESHGMASLNQGWMEATLDRRLMQDDWRGLNEGPHDNALSPSGFILIPEKRNTPGEVEGPSCFLSPLATALSQHLNNPFQVAFTNQDHITPPMYSKEVAYVSFLRSPVPCPYALLNLRHKNKSFSPSAGAKISALLILHKMGMDCNFSLDSISCQREKSLNLDVFYNNKIDSAMEMSITGVEGLQSLPSLITQINEMEVKTIKLTFSNPQL